MRLPTLHTILLLASLLASLCFWPSAPVNADESWATYQLPQYDYTILLPKAWDVLPPASRDSALTIRRTAANEGFLIYARYHLAVHPHQPYAELISAGMPSQVITLHNGARAIQFEDNNCQTVVWIYHAIERFVSGCGLD